MAGEARAGCRRRQGGRRAARVTPGSLDAKRTLPPSTRPFGSTAALARAEPGVRISPRGPLGIVHVLDMVAA
jgi:hypothetical protein